jgi:hypothetical protein
VTQEGLKPEMHAGKALLLLPDILLLDSDSDSDYESGETASEGDKNDIKDALLWTIVSVQSDATLRNLHIYSISLDSALEIPDQIHKPVFDSPIVAGTSGFTPLSCAPLLVAKQI